MKKGKMMAIIAISGILKVYGQGMVPGAESAALGGISVVLENAWSAAGNPAGLAGFSHFTLNTSFEQRFLVKELGDYAFALTVPAWQGTLGMSAEFTGYQGFSKETVALAYGKRFGSILGAGISVFYIYRKAGAESPAVHQASYSIGASLLLSGQITLAFSAFNPFDLSYKSKDYSSLPTVFRFGVSYKPAASLAILGEIEKDLDYPLIFRVGCAFNAMDKIYIQGGISMFPASFSLGAGVRLHRLLIGLASAYHQYLGFSPCTSIQYQIK